MTYEEIFKQVKKNFEKANAKNIKREFAFQFNITGEGEGIFYAAFKNGGFVGGPYDYKDRDVIFTADGKTLIDISSGKVEPIEAIEHGRLAVEGNDLSNQLMVLIPAEKKSAVKKAEAKPAPERKVAAKPEANKANNAAKAAAKPAAPKAEAKPAVKQEAPKSEAKPAAKTEAKPAAKAEAPKTEAKPAVKAEAPKAETKPAAPAAKTDAKNGKK